MQLETDQHWYALFGFFFTQQSDEQKLEILQPWTREKVLIEMFDILKNGRDDRLKINLLIFLEENTDFFFSTHPTVFQGTCTLLNELLTLPTAPKIVQNPRDPNNPSYTPYTPNHVKTQVLITLTTILITSDTIRRQPSTIESMVDILFEIMMHVNDSHDRLLRQTAAEALRELSVHFSGLLITRLGLLLHLAKEERMHAKQSYTTLFSTALVSSLDCIKDMAAQSIAKFDSSPTPDSAFEHFEATLKSLGISSFNNSTGSLSSSTSPVFGSSVPTTHSSFLSPSIRLLNTSHLPQTPDQEMPSFQLPNGIGGQCWHLKLSAPIPNFHWIQFFRADLEQCASFLLDQVPYCTIFEATRIMQHVVYLIQTTFVSRESFDDLNDRVFMPHIGNHHKSIAVCTEMLVRHDRLASVVRWALQSNNALLWHIAACVLSRVPLSLIQPLISRTTAESDMIASNQPLTLMLRDNLLSLSRNFSFLGEKMRVLLVEWISRRPLHSDQDHCAYLITTTPSHITPQGRVITSFPARENAGSPEFPIRIANKRHLICPSPFDSPLLNQAKLTSLAYTYSPASTTTNTQNPSLSSLQLSPTSPPEPSSSSIDRQHIPKTFMRVMSIFQDYALNPSSMRALFQIFTHYLLNFPSIFDPIMQYLESILIEHPRFADEMTWEVIRVVRIQNRQLGKLVVIRLCRFLAILPPPLIFNYLPLILRIVRLKFVSVDVLLEALRLNLRCSDLLREGRWSFGNTLVEIVHLVLLHHNIATVLTPSCNLLALLGKQFGNFEIRDRASFYLQLLTHVPADKVRTIIEVTSQSIAENVDVENPFVNTEASKLGSAPLSFKSTVTGDLSSKASDLVPPNLLSLEKTSSLFNLNSLERLMSQTSENTVTQHESPILPSYYETLESYRTPKRTQAKETDLEDESGPVSTSQDQPEVENPFRVQIPFLLRFKTPSELRKEGGNLSHLPLSLYSLALKLTGSLLYSNHVHTVEVPFLASRVKSEAEMAQLLVKGMDGSVDSTTDFLGEPSSSEPRYGTTTDLLPNQGSSVFPYSYSFVLSMKVILPLPTMLQVTALANTAEGAVAEFTLDPVRIGLKDLFMPIPPQLVESLSASNGCLAYDSFIHQLYDEMWTSLSPSPKTESTAPDADSRRNAAVVPATSVKFIAKTAKAVVEAIHLNLAPYLLRTKRSPTREHAIIFLPHKYHLLLAFEISEESTIVRIQTDWWRILGHLDRFFDELWKPQQAQSTA